MVCFRVRFDSSFDQPWSAPEKDGEVSIRIMLQRISPRLQNTAGMTDRVPQNDHSAGGENLAALRTP